MTNKELMKDFKWTINKLLDYIQYEMYIKKDLKKHIK